MTSGCMTGCAKVTPGPVREHFAPRLDYQDRMARFLENHDEPRAAATFSPEVHRPRLLSHISRRACDSFTRDSSRGGRRAFRRICVAGPLNLSIERLRQFYDRLLAVLRRARRRDGQWQLPECVPAWEGNWTADCFLAFTWQGDDGKRLVVTVNYAANHSQCHVRLPCADLAGTQWRMQDLLGDTVYERDGNDLHSRGLYVDVPSWEHFAFELTALPGA